METREFLTVEVNEPMLTAQTYGKFAALSPNLAKCALKYGHEYNRYNFGRWLTDKLLDEVYDNLALYFERYMDEWHEDELRKAEKKDEEFFETLMFPACKECKKVNSYTAYHGVCVRGRMHQCSSSLDAEEWVNSERYKEILERIERKEQE